MDIKLPEARAAKAAQEDDESDSMFFGISEGMDELRSPPEAILDGNLSSPRAPNPPSEKRNLRKAGGKPSNDEHHDDTPMRRALGKSVKGGGPVTLRRSYDKSSAKRTVGRSKKKKKEGDAGHKNSGKNVSGDDDDMEDLSTLMKGIVEDIKKMEVEDGGGSDHVGDEGFAKICTVLSTNNNLIELDVGDNQIGVDSAIMAADMLRSNTALCVLNISDNPIQYSGVMSLADALRINETLQVCYVGVDSLGAEGMQELTCNDAVEAFWSTRLVVI